MVKLGEVVEKKPVFEGFDKTTKEEKLELVDKELSIKALAKFDKKKEDESFGVVLYSLVGEERLKTMTVSNAMLEQVEEAVEKIGIDEELSSKMEKYLKDALEVTFRSKKSQSSQFSYFIFE